MGAVLNFSVQQQQVSEWCWLAVASSIDAYYGGGTKWSQCLLANDQLGQTTCCVDMNTTSCNNPGSISSALGRVQRLRTSVSSQILFEGIQDEINAGPPGRPIAAGITWSTGDIGHAVIIVGWDVSGGEQYVYIADPAAAKITHIPLQSFQTYYDGKGAWTDTYFTKA